MKEPKDPFLKYIYLSVGLHVAVLLALTLKVALFPSKPSEFQQSVRVDVVALPEKNIEKPKVAEVKKPEPVKKKEKPKPEKKVAEKKPEPKPKPKPKKKVFSEKKLKDKQNRAVEQLTATAKIKKRLEEKNKKEETKAVEFKGNQISRGYSPDGGINQLYHNNYQEQLFSHIRNHWRLPEWLDNKELRASVVIMINRRGAIIAKNFVLKSGNDIFDQQVFTTLDKAAPVPAPPAKLAKAYETQGIEIRFPE